VAWFRTDSARYFGIARNRPPPLPSADLGEQIAGRIVCLIVDGDPNASDRSENPAAECVPPALPFQLAAGIAGVGFDELKQRELQRQLRHALVMSVASTALLVTMAGLSLVALLARLGRAAEALASHTLAIELYDRLPTDSPGRTVEELQRHLSTKGAFEASLGRFADAAASYERSLTIADITEKDLAPLGVGLEAARGGLVAVSVQPRSPADDSGLQAGDLMTSMAGVPLADAAQMGDVRARMTAGEAMDVHVVRDGQPMNVLLTPVHIGNFLVASTKYNLGYLYLTRHHQPEKARPWLVESVDEYRRAPLRETSAAPDIREGLAYAAGVLGTCGYQLGNAALQERGMREGVAASEENVRANPSVPRQRTTLAINLANVATWPQQHDELEEAAARCREATEHLHVALEAGGNLTGDRLHLLKNLSNLASITADLSGPEKRVAHL